MGHEDFAWVYFSGVVTVSQTILFAFIFPAVPQCHRRFCVDFLGSLTVSQAILYSFIFPAMSQMSQTILPCYFRQCHSATDDFALIFPAVSQLSQTILRLYFRQCHGVSDTDLKINLDRATASQAAT